MPHDEHFLTRLDRVSDSYDELELALGLYRDHELVRFVLDHVRLPEAAERVAFALTADRGGPHVIVARDGGFVTCLAAGMKVGPHPVISRGQLDALATKHERVRTGIALARKRGTDSSALLRKMIRKALQLDGRGAPRTEGRPEDKEATHQGAAARDDVLRGLAGC